MDFDFIKNKISAKKLKPEEYFETYAVLLPLVEIDGSIYVLFEIRAKGLNRQPGEICFPGGKIEKDESPLDAAIRETCEELKVRPDKIDVFGPLDCVITPFNVMIYPCAGRLKDIKFKDISFNRGEVSEIFVVPLDYLMNFKPLAHFVDVKMFPHEDFPFHLIENGENYQWRKGRYPVFFYKYENFVIWGLTARILKNFLDTIR
jgi:8-oxo-dGTP pyrophosphatase MutT (NUDIX family)